VQLGMSYTIGEPYTLEYWEKLALAMQEMGADSICVKDMAGLMLPEAATELIGMLKDRVSVPIHLHSHCTSGTAPMTYYAAVQAGVDGIDTAISPFSGGTSQPATEVMVETFKGTDRDTGIDLEVLEKIAVHFEGVRDRALASGLMSTKVLGTDIKTLIYQVPGGMLSNLISQLKDQNAEDKYMDVLREIPRVRNDLGMPPLVTPSSQIVGTQAVLNILAGERYAMLSKETRELLLGKYGATTLPVDQELLKKVNPNDVITCRPADLLEPELPGIEEKIKEYMIQEEDILTYGLYDKVAMEFFKRRSALADNVAPSAIDHENKAYPA
jgi:oxaloacetate decarboxylase alpha subunit